MPLLELSAISNPRRDREYFLELSSAAPLPCRVDGLQSGAQASFTLRYTPGQHCLEARSFGRFLSHRVQEEELDHALLDRIMGEITDCCSPLKAELEVDITAPDGGQLSFSTSYPSSSPK